MRVVIDTNIFISGIFWSGSPYEILKLWIDGKFQVIFTLEILDECYRVLNEIGKDLDSSLADDWIIFIRKNAIIIEKIYNFEICKDRDDNKFINCALSGNANYIVTGDKDLLNLIEFKGVKIVNSREFLKIIRNR